MTTQAIQLERLVNRRSRDLAHATRTEVLTSVFAATFFVAILSWRLPHGQNPYSQLGYLAVVLWSAITLYRFRRQLWPPPSDFAAPGVEHYRTLLARRRDHLKNVWLWHGPLVLACLTPLAVLIPQFPGRICNMRPFIALLLLWIVLGIILRRNKAADLQREIDELNLQ